MMESVVEAFMLLCIAVSIILVLSVMVRFYETGRWVMFMGGVISLCFLMSLLFNSALVLFMRGMHK